MVDRTLAQALETRRRSIAQATEVAGGIFTASAFFDTNGCGEGIQHVFFGVRFTEKPVMSFGWDLKHNQPLIDGSFPQVHVGVANWNQGQRFNSAGTFFYDGATICFKTIAPQTFSFTIHVTFQGKGLRGPAGNGS